MLLAAGSLVAQEPNAAKSDAPAAKRTSDPSRRVPPFFGQIGLTTEQKESIYKIRGKHQAKIDELEKQIDELQAQMLAESESVLTDDQKQMLAQRRKTASTGKKGEVTEKKGKAENKSGG